MTQQSPLCHMQRGLWAIASRPSATPLSLRTLSLASHTQITPLLHASASFSQKSFAARSTHYFPWNCVRRGISRLTMTGCFTCSYIGANGGGTPRNSWVTGTAFPSSNCSATTNILSHPPMKFAWLMEACRFHKWYVSSTLKSYKIVPKQSLAIAVDYSHG